jgi:hypothetical protein
LTPKGDTASKGLSGGRLWATLSAWCHGDTRNTLYTSSVSPQNLVETIRGLPCGYSPNEIYLNIIKFSIQAIENYNDSWSSLDHSELVEVIKGYMVEIDVSNILAEIKMEVMQTVDEDMKYIYIY